MYVILLALASGSLSAQHPVRHHRFYDDGSTWYITTGSDTTVNDVQNASSQTLAGKVTLATGNDDATVETPVNVNGNLQWVSVTIYGANSLSNAGSECDNTEVTLSLNPTTHNIEVGMSDGGISVNDMASAPKGFRGPFRRDRNRPPMRLRLGKHVFSLISFRIRRLRGSQGTTFGGLGTTYKVVEMGTSDTFNYEVDSANNGGQMLFNETAFDTPIPQDYTEIVDSDLSGKIPIHSREPTQTIRSHRKAKSG